MNWPAQWIGLAEGSCFILLLWVVFRVTPRISPDNRAWLWRLSILKLALSVFAVGQVTLAVLPPAQIAPARANAPIEVLRVASSSERIDQTASTQYFPAPSQKEVGQITAPAQIHGPTLAVLFFWAWLGGFALFVLQILLEVFRVRKLFAGSHEVEAQEILAVLRALSHDVGLGRVPRLLRSDDVLGPMVYGIWRPTIVVPTDLAANCGEDLRLALAHEVAHIQRRDLAWVMIAWLVRSLLFFNPTAWLAEKELRAVQESATDQEAVWVSGSPVSRYGEMLLHAMRPGQANIHSTGLPMADSFANALRRLRAMKSFSERPKPFHRALTMSTLLGGVVLLPTYLVAQASPSKSPSMVQDLGHRQVSAVAQTSGRSVHAGPDGSIKRHVRNFKLTPISVVVSARNLRLKQNKRQERAILSIGRQHGKPVPRRMASAKYLDARKGNPTQVKGLNGGFVGARLAQFPQVQITDQPHVLITTHPRPMNEEEQEEALQAAQDRQEMALDRQEQMIEAKAEYSEDKEESVSESAPNGQKESDQRAHETEERQRENGQLAREASVRQSEAKKRVQESLARQREATQQARGNEERRRETVKRNREANERLREAEKRNREGAERQREAAKRAFEAVARERESEQRARESFARERELEQRAHSKDNQHRKNLQSQPVQAQAPIGDGGWQVELANSLEKANEETRNQIAKAQAESEHSIRDSIAEVKASGVSLQLPKTFKFSWSPHRVTLFK